MNVRDFQNKIISIKKELSDLRTNHLRGLGTFIFSQKTASVTTTSTNQTARFTVQFATDASFPTVFYYSLNGRNRTITTNSSQKTIVFQTSTAQLNYTLRLQIIAMAEISSITGVIL